MLARFFEKYPEYAGRTFLSVKVRVLHNQRLHESQLSVIVGRNEGGII